MTELQEKNFSIEEIQKELARYVYMGDAMKAMKLAYETKNNIIFYGKGGHGKSELTMDFFDMYGVDPFIVTMGSGMTTDKLFGGLDLNEFNKTGKIEYLVENSWMAAEYVIFEEMMDAPDFVLEMMKDILSRGEFRNGNQVYKINTKLIVCNTNRTRDEFMKNDSLRALMERFPLEKEVKWQNYNRLTYTNLLETVNGKGTADPLLVYILDKLSNMSNFIISPRIALKAAEIIKHGGIDSLEFIAEFNAKKQDVSRYIASFKNHFEIIDMKNVLAELEAKINAIIDDPEMNPTQFEEAKVLVHEHYKNCGKVVKMKVSGEDIEFWKELKLSAKSFQDKAARRINALEDLTGLS